MKTFQGRLGLQQRVLPDYRVPFFDLLAQACDGGLSVFAGQPRQAESIKSGETRVAQHAEARNLHLFAGLAYLCYQQGLIQWLQEWDPGALIVEANPRYLSTPRAVRWMHERGRPVLAWGLGSPPIAGPLREQRQQRRLKFLSQFDGVLAYSRRGAEEYAALGVPRFKIRVAHNAAARIPVQPPASKAAAADKLTLLFVGRLQARKRVDLLLQAAAQIQPAPRVIIVGDGPERAGLEALAQQIYPGAEFVGEKHGSELAPWFGAADLFVLPGTGGLAIQEAMSYGLPVLVAQGDGTQDDLVRPENGWQVRPGNLDALLAALRQALSQQGELRRKGQESYRIVAEEINLEKMVESFVQALNESEISGPGASQRASAR